MTQQDARALQKAESRRRLVASARTLCERDGFVGVRTAQIARKARLSHGAVFVHFPTRDDLLVEVASGFAQEVTGELHRLVSQQGTLRTALAAHVDSIARHEALYRNLLIEAPLLPAGLRAAWIGIQSAVSFHIAAAAEREEKAGLLRAMPAHLLFNTWVGLVHHYVLNRDLFAPGASVMERYGEELIAHFLTLVSTTPPPKERSR